VAVPKIISDAEFKHMNNQVERYMRVFITQYKFAELGKVKIELVRLATYNKATLAEFDLAVAFIDQLDYDLFCQSEGLEPSLREFQNFSRERAGKTSITICRTEKEKGFTPSLIRRLFHVELNIHLPLALNGRIVLPKFVN
jgi:hypothetical protein